MLLYKYVCYKYELYKKGKDEQLLMVCLGEAGTGKSTLITGI
jgi:hypothetical protein